MAARRPKLAVRLAARSPRAGPLFAATTVQEKRQNVVWLPNGLGDAIQTLPALQGLGRIENSELIVVANKKVHRLFKEVFEIKGRYLTDAEFRSDELRSATLDALLDFNGLIDPAFESSLHARFEVIVGHTLFTDATITTGSPCIKVNGMLTKSRFFNAIGYPPLPAWTHYFAMLKKICPEPKDWPAHHGFPYLYPSAGRKYQVPQSYGFLPCGSLKSKHWPLRRYIDLAAQCECEGYGVHFYLGEAEKAYAIEIAKALTRPVIEVGLELEDLAIKLQQHQLIITNDCGPMHLAAAMDLPLIAIFRATLPQCWFPYRRPHQKVIGGPRDAVYRAEALDLPWPTVAEVKLQAEDLINT